MKKLLIESKWNKNSQINSEQKKIIFYFAAVLNAV